MVAGMTDLPSEPQLDEPQRRRITHLATVRDVIAALGGLQNVAAMTGRGRQACSMWQTHNRIPPRFYCLMKRKLHRIGCDANESLWGQ
jgi:hypothetical protein